jgi:hypothetical protein
MQLISSEPRTGSTAYKADHARVHAAMKWRAERRIGDRMWRRAEKLYKGEHWTHNDESADLTSDNARDNITVNITASMINDYSPFLVRRNPRFILHPRPKKNDLEHISLLIEQGKVNSYVLNYYWEQFGIQDAFRDAIDDGLVYGTGIVKTGWALELAEAVNPKRHGKIEMDTKYKVNNPFARRVSPYMFHFDPQSPDRSLRTSRWAAELIFMPLQDVVENKQFDRSVRLAIASGKETPTTVASYLKAINADDEWVRIEDDDMKGQQLVVLWEYWDNKFETYKVYVDNIEKPVIEERVSKFPYLDEFFPYLKWDFIKAVGEPYGWGIPAMIEDQQREKNRIRTTEFHHRRKYGTTKFGVTHNQIDASELTKLTSDEDEVFFVKGPVNQVIAPFNAPPINSDNYRVDAIIDEDMRRMLGLDALHSGGNLPSRTSAREIDARTSLMGTKLQGRVEAVDAFATAIAKQVWKHTQENMDENDLIQIVGEEGKMLWQEVTPEQIQGEFDFEIISSSKEDPDPVQERQQRTQLMQVLFQNQEALAASGAMLDTAAVLKWVLDSYERPETEGFIVPMPPPEPAPPTAGNEVALGAGDRDAQIQQEQASAGSAVQGAARGGGVQIGS